MTKSLFVMFCKLVGFDTIELVYLIHEQDLFGIILG
jgi:hypothetical protein